MIPGITLSGLQSAEYQVNRSASRLVNHMSVPAMSEPAGQEQDVSGAGIGFAGLSSASYMASDVNVVNEVVNMTQASQAYKANIAVFKVWDEMMQQASTLRRHV